MKLPHLHHRDPGHNGADSEHTLSDADYDAQADLALPSHESTHGADGFVPYAGELAPSGDTAGYDAYRDTGVDPS